MKLFTQSRPEILHDIFAILEVSRVTPANAVDTGPGPEGAGCPCDFIVRSVFSIRESTAGNHTIFVRGRESTSTEKTGANAETGTRYTPRLGARSGQYCEVS